MDIKSDSFAGSGDYFDIPAAEQEVTVDSNDQPNTSSTVGASLVQNIPTVRNDTILQPVSQQVFRLPSTPQNRPRVIMLQRTNQGQIVGTQQAQSHQSGQEIRVSHHQQYLVYPLSEFPLLSFIFLFRV